MSVSQDCQLFDVSKCFLLYLALLSGGEGDKGCRLIGIFGGVESILLVLFVVYGPRLTDELH